MLRVALCDDDFTISIAVKELVISFAMKKNFEVSFEYYPTADKLLNTKEQYDVLFLDIALDNNQDGIELGKKLRKNGNSAVFILLTSLNDRYQDGYEANVFRYLTKPISKIKFDKALGDAVDFLFASQTKFNIKCSGDSFFMNVNDIIYIESYNRKRLIHTIDNTTYTTTESLETLLKRLPRTQFAHPQKSFIVNFAHIKRMNKCDMEMRCGKNLTITGKRYHEFNLAFMRYLSSMPGGIIK